MLTKTNIFLEGTLFATVAVAYGIFYGAERVKRFVYVNLCCIINN